MLYLLGTEKLTERRDKLCSAITHISDSFNKLSSAYLCLLTTNEMVESFTDKLDIACDALQDDNTHHTIDYICVSDISSLSSHH